MALRRALVSVSDKTGVVDFCRDLAELGFEVVSTGGTLAALQAAGVSARQVSEITSMPEILGGRVKTLHPIVFGGILARRNDAGDMETIAEHGMEPIDVVAVNLYPFAQTVANPKAHDEEIIEQIDIGGPSLIRAAAKNHSDIYVVVDPSDYSTVIDALRSGRHADYLGLRRSLSAKVFEHTAGYDKLIGSYLSNKLDRASFEGTTADTQRVAESPSITTESGARLPRTLSIEWPLRQVLRYGENPHQAAAFYADPEATAPSLAHCTQLQGKELSYNNYLDGETALEMVREFHAEPAAVILKHLNPCGAGRGASVHEAYQRALACDPTSAFGGIVGVTREVDAALAEEISKTFMEVVIAPSFSAEAQEVFGRKKNLRLLACGPLTARESMLACKSISGGMLVQQLDTALAAREAMQVVSRTLPTEEDWEGLLFAWKVCKWVKSNAIVYADRRQTLGIGAGQMSRVDSANFGLQKAGGKIPGAYMASDAFFPFRDVVDIAHSGGVRAIIQPGGSIRDEESVRAADEHGIVMVFTGMRHFRH